VALVLAQVPSTPPARVLPPINKAFQVRSFIFLPLQPFCLIVFLIITEVMHLMVAQAVLPFNQECATNTITSNAARISHQGSEFWIDLAKQVGRSAAEA